MNIQDRIMEPILAAFDRLMDLITFGAWSRWQGSRVVDLVVNKELK
jgi:hypothetical protein